MVKQWKYYFYTFYFKNYYKIIILKINVLKYLYFYLFQLNIFLFCMFFYSGILIKYNLGEWKKWLQDNFILFGWERIKIFLEIIFSSCVWFYSMLSSLIGGTNKNGIVGLIRFLRFGLTFFGEGFNVCQKIFFKIFLFENILK